MLGTPKEQVIQYCKILSDKGWLPGNSGGVAFLNQSSINNKCITITPENIPKSMLRAGDLFELRWMFDAQSFVPPSLSKSDNPHSIAKNAPLYLQIIGAAKAAFVIEFSSVWAALASRLAMRTWERNAVTYPTQLRLAHWGLLEQLGSESEVILSVIERGPDMQKQVESALTKGSVAVLIRDYGLLVWGDSPIQTIAKAEVLDRLCELQVKEFRLLGRT